MRCVFILFILLSTISFAAEAQAPEIGRIGLYADSSRTANEVDLPAPYVSFELYIFCQPSENGMFCADFALEYPSSIFIVSHEWHPDVAIVLGDVIPGVSACFVECRADWVCIYRATMMSMESGPASINIVRHSSVGYYQFVTCLEGRPLEPVFFGPGLCINSSCPPDTDPPVPVSIEAEDDSHVTVRFDGRMFEPDADIPSSFNLYPVNAPADSVSVIFSRLQGDDDEVWMILGDHLAQSSYIIEMRNLRDIAGNIMADGTTVVFGGVDTTPPELLNDSAPNDSTAVVVFNEPLDEASVEEPSHYTIECEECSCVPEVVSAEFQPDSVSIILSLSPRMEQMIWYRISFDGVTDLAGNPILEHAWVQPPDTIPPEITGIALLADTALSVTWSECANPASLADPANYSLVRSGPPPEPLNLTDVWYINCFVYGLSFEPALAMETEYILYVEGVMDGWMNVMLPDTFVLLFPDTIPPVLLDAVCTGMKSVDLTFDEPVDPVTAVSVSRYKVYPQGIPADSIVIDNVELLAGGMGVRIHLVSGMIVGRVYTVQAAGNQDLAGNSNPLQTLDFTCQDLFPPEVQDIFLSDFTHVNVQFDEVVNEAAEVTANYVLHETADSSALFGIESAVLHDGGSRVVLTTASPLVESESYTLNISGIEDMLGHLIDPETAKIFAAHDVIAPVLLGLSVTSDSIVHLEFNESLDLSSAEDIGNYIVMGSYDTSIVLELQSAVLDSAGTTVDLEIDGRAEIGRLYKVRIAGVADVSGNILYTESGAFLFIDDIPPELLSAEALSGLEVAAWFSEKIDNVTGRMVSNYKIYIKGDSLSTVNISSAGGGSSRMSRLLRLGEHLEQGTEYTLEVNAIEDISGNTIEPRSTADFLFLDSSPPEIIRVSVSNDKLLFVYFNEMLDYATATDIDNYLLYISSDPSQVVQIDTILYQTNTVRIELTEPLIQNVGHTLSVEGVADWYGNLCPALYYEGIYHYVWDPKVFIALFADDAMNSNYVEAGLYTVFRIYVWVKPDTDGAIAAEYALSPPQYYGMTNLTYNPAIVSLPLGDPFGGHNVSFSTCVTDWVWIDYLDCMMLQDGAESVYPISHPETGQIRIMTCEEGNPYKAVEATLPLIINEIYIGTLLENWNASYGSGIIELSWSLQDTGDVPEFEVSRTFESVSAWQPLPAGLIRGDGLKYTMLDPDLEYGMSYRYRVEYVDEDGRKILFETDAISTPTMPLTLRQNSPNPFNPATEIGFFLPQPGHVRLEIFGVSGKLVSVLADGHHASGEHSVEWDGRDRGGSHVTSGVYFYRLTAGKESLSRKMVLLR